MARRRTKKRTHLPHPHTIKDGKQTSTGLTQPLNASASPIPKTMVIRIGASEVGPSVSTLVHDVRSMMEPHTASRLRERKSNKLRDYVTMAGPLGVSQLLLFSRSETGHTNLRIARCPRGPTIHFRINEYSLCKDIRKVMRNPKSPGKEFSTPPLLVMNNLKSPVPKNPDGTPGRTLPQDELLMSMFRSMFPEITVNTPVNNYRRVMVINRKPEEEGSNKYILDIRHYAISTKVVGVSKAIRRLNKAEHVVHRNSPDPTKMGGKKSGLPNLGKLEDISEYMLDPAAAAGYTSESDFEEEAQVEILNPAVKNAGKKRKLNRGPEKRSIHLTELGPRMTLEMMKIEEGLADGKTLWHAYEKKTKEEIRALERRHAQRQTEKDKRRKEQLANVEKKNASKVLKKAAKKAAKEAAKAAAGEDAEEGEEGEGSSSDDSSDEEMEDFDEFAQYEGEDEGEEEAESEDENEMEDE